MIIVDIHIGRFSILIQKETYRKVLEVAQEEAGETIIDLPWFSIILTNHHKRLTV